MRLDRWSLCCATTLSVGEGVLLQSGTDPLTAFLREKEGYEFELRAGPTWLELDKGTGVLGGRPGAGDVGAHHITIECHPRFPHELKRGDYRASYFLKDHPRFQAKCEQSFEIEVR